MGAFLHKHRLFVLFVVIGLAALLLYWPVLSLPLLFDDLLHIRLTKGLDFRSVWLPSTDFGFFRPFVFLPFLIIKQLFGYYPSTLLHGLSWLQQALNAVLITTLVWRLWHRWTRAFAAGLLLATYPFAYQAIAFYGNNVYPLAAGLMLCLLHLYLWGQNGRYAIWVMISGLFLIGLLTHETMALFGPLAALIQWSANNEFEPRKWRWSPTHSVFTNLRTILNRSPYLIFIAMGIIYIIIYQFLPRGSGPSLADGSNELWPKLLYLLQSAVYPLAWFAHLLPNISAGVIIIGGILILMFWSLWAARRPKNRLALLLGWGWWFMASLLIGINLPTYYIHHGARLLYLGGVGVALIWAVLLDSLFVLNRRGRVVWVLLLAGIAITSSLFVRGRLDAFAQISSPLAVMAETMAERPSDEGMLLVNLPAWTSPPRNTYPIGVEYVTLMGYHLFAEELIQENLGGNRPVLAVELPDSLQDTGYPYGVHARGELAQPLANWTPAGATVFITTIADSGISTRETGQLLPSTAVANPLATIGPYTLQGASVTCSSPGISLSLTWQATTPPAPTHSIFVQLLDSAGQLIDQADGPPLDLAPAAWTLPNGWQIIDRRALNPPEGSQPAQLLIGVYNFASGERQTAVDSSANPLPDNALRLMVQPCN